MVGGGELLPVSREEIRLAESSKPMGFSLYFEVRNEGRCYTLVLTYPML